MQALREIIINKLNSLEEIPSMFKSAIEIQKLIEEYSSTSRQISEFIKLDPALTAKVLKLANSPMFAANHQITDLQQVVTRLGLAEVQKITMSVAVVSSFPNHHLDYQKFWIHSIAVGFMAQYFHHLLQPLVRNTYIFTCGVLHETGALLLDIHFPDIYKRVFESAIATGKDLHVVEREMLDIDHSEATSILFKKWNLPQAIIDVLENYRLPQMAQIAVYNSRLLYLAEFVVNNQGFDNGSGHFPSGFDDGIWDDLGLDIEHVPEILSQVSIEVAKAERMLSFS